MLRATTAILYTETAPQGVFDQAKREERTVYCYIQSVGMTETYEAMAHGLRPELKLWLPESFEYEGEPFVELEEKQYEVLRVYIDETDGITLTLQRRGKGT